jgi:hypothetical protein
MSIYTDQDRAGRAEDRLLQQALQVVAIEYEDPGNPHHDDALAYAQEQLALAAQELVDAVDKLPEEIQPVGWTDIKEN